MTASTAMFNTKRKLLNMATRLFRPRPSSYYILNLRSFLTYNKPISDFLLAFVLQLSEHYPRPISIRTKTNPHLSLIANDHQDLMTINEIFSWKCYSYRSTTTETVLDLGANSGFSAAYFLSSNANANVMLFEPNTYLSPFINSNLSSFSSTRYSLNHLAISHSTGTSHLDISSHSRYSHLVDQQTNTTLSVDTITLGDAIKLCISKFGRCDVLKIDIEGLGFKILDSLPPNFSPAPHTIFVEETYDSSLPLLFLKSNYTLRIHPSGIYTYTLIT